MASAHAAPLVAGPREPKPLGCLAACRGSWESPSPHPPAVASNLTPPREQGQAEDDAADGDGQPEEGVVAHLVMVPLVPVTVLSVTIAVVLTAPA